MYKIQNPWLYAARPKTLFVSISPVLIGTCMAFETEHFSLHIFMLTLIGALLIQIGTNYANDYFDFIKHADTASRLGPKKVLQANIVSPLQMKGAFIICFLLAAIIGIALASLKGPLMIWITLASILSGILYSAGPFSLARVGLADIFVLIFFGPIATMTTYYLHTSEIHLTTFLASLPPGLLGIAVLTVNNLRDYEEDKQAGKNTLVVRWGLTYGKWQYLICFIISALIPVIISIATHKHMFACLASCALFPSAALIRHVFAYQDPRELNLILPKTGALLLFYTGCFCLGWIL